MPPSGRRFALAMPSPGDALPWRSLPLATPCLGNAFPWRRLALATLCVDFDLPVVDFDLDLVSARIRDGTGITGGTSCENLVLGR